MRDAQSSESRAWWRSSPEQVELMRAVMEGREPRPIPKQEIIDDRGIGVTPPAQPSEYDRQSLLRTVARNRMRTGMFDEDIKRKGYQQAYNIVARVKPQGLQYNAQDYLTESIPFGDEFSAAVEAGLDYLWDRSKGFQYDRTRTRRKDARESYAVRHPFVSGFSELGAGFPGGAPKRQAGLPEQPTWLGQVAQDYMSGMIEGAVKGFSDGEGFMNRMQNAAQGAIRGAADGGRDAILMQRSRAPQRPRYYY